MPSSNATHIHITQYQTADQPSIRRILEHIGWDEPYILAFEQIATRFAENNDMAVFMARQQVTNVCQESIFFIWLREGARDIVA